MPTTGKAYREYIACPKPTREKRGKRKQPKSERRQLEAKLDTLTSLIVRWRDECCVICGKIEFLDCGHLIKRGKRAIRWNLKNTNGQCRGCNFKHNHYPEVYTLWFILTYGQDEYDKLVRLSERGIEITVPELRALLERYQALWDNRPSVYDRAELVRLGYYGDIT